jgi:hypothetical protein
LKNHDSPDRSPRTFLGFFAAALTALEAMLLKVLGSVRDANQAFIVLSALFVLVILLVALVAILKPGVVLGHLGPIRRDEPPGGAVEYRYDVFISTPMSSFDRTRYASHRKDILKVTALLEQQCNLKCYFAGQNRLTLADFETSDISLHNDYKALARSRYFLLVYPESIVSSVLVEAGVAIALNKPSIYFKQTGATLPFMLRNAANTDAADIPRIRIYEYTDVSHVLQMIRVNGSRLFGGNLGKGNG